MAEDKKEEKKAKHAGHGYSRTETEHHADGSMTMKHTVHPDHRHEMKDQSYAVSDLDGMHDGIEDHIGSPNEGEGEGEDYEAGAQK